MSAAPRKVTVFIPTLDAGPEFHLVLEALQNQKAPFEIEIRVIDSGSTDETLPTLARFGITPGRITRETFDHGEIRGRAVREATGDLVAFLSQDARPASDTYLSDLARPFADPRVAGAWAHQSPHPDAHPFQVLHLAAHGAGKAAARTIESVTPAEWESLSPAARLDRLGFDDVASMVRRDVALRIPYRAAAFGEDMTWARDVLTRGFRLAFVPEADVLHSHAFSFAELRTRTERTYELRKRLTGEIPIPGGLTLLRRIFGQTLRFLAAALRNRKRTGVPNAIAAALIALPAAIVQMRAVRRGAARAEYVPVDR